MIGGSGDMDSKGFTVQMRMEELEEAEGGIYWGRRGRNWKYLWKYFWKYFGEF